MTSKTNSKRIKLVYVCVRFSSELGGPFYNLFIELSKYIDVVCIAIGQRYCLKKPERTEIINPHFKVRRYEYKHFPFAKDVIIPINLDKILDEEKPDVVQSDEFFRFISMKAARWAKRNNVPYILSSRMKYREGFIRNSAIWLFSILPSVRRVIKYAERIIATQGDCSKKEFLRWFPKVEKKFVIIPSGLNIEGFKKHKTKSLNQICKENNLNINDIKERKILLSIARIDSMKRLDLLMEIFAKIKKQYSDVIFMHVGPMNNETEMQKIQTVIKQKNLQKDSFFLGTKENKELPSYYKIADVFLNTSIGEGICFSFLEAMAFNIPIVAFNQGGNYCAINDGENGFLVDNDNQDLFAKRVVEILKNPKLQKKLGKKGYKKLQTEFNIKENAEKYVKVYRSVLEK